MFVYSITNIDNGKRYIGKTSLARVNDRWKDHRRKLREGYHVNQYLQRSYNIHGSDAFSYEILYECANLEELNDCETINIIRFRTCNPEFGYNMSFGGEGTNHSPETRAKLSQSASKRIGELNPFYGKTHTNESRKAIGVKSKERIPSIESRKKMSESGKRKTLTEEHKNNIRLACLGKPKTRKTT